MLLPEKRIFISRENIQDAGRSSGKFYLPVNIFEVNRGEMLVFPGRVVNRL